MERWKAVLLVVACTFAAMWLPVTGEAEGYLGLPSTVKCGPAIVTIVERAVDVDETDQKQACGEAGVRHLWWVFPAGLVGLAVALIFSKGPTEPSEHYWDGFAWRNRSDNALLPDRYQPPPPA
ncbi:hypothetical protein [Mycolicibacterium sp.]|uniref:hypothetical protein n=1 Tax=Mycolicibacterium sp. TaxID=2320850 RepID=UPI00355D3E1A